MEKFVILYNGVGEKDWMVCDCPDQLRQQLSEMISSGQKITDLKIYSINNIRVDIVPNVVLTQLD